MAPAPSLASIGTDTLWCLGLGLLVAMLREAAGFAWGNGRVRCFVWDVLAFCLAAVLLCGFTAGASASGVARWYMAGGMAAGALAWRLAIGGSVRHWLAALWTQAAKPWRYIDKHCLRPALGKARQRMKSMFALHAKMPKKHEKKAKTRKKQLQKPQRVLYN